MNISAKTPTLKKMTWMDRIKVLVVVAFLSFVLGFIYSQKAQAQESKIKKVIYPKKTSLDFSGLSIEGEIRNPGEFYFQRKQEEKFDSLVKRRKNFQKEMLRDVVLSK